MSQVANVRVNGAAWRKPHRPGTSDSTAVDDTGATYTSVVDTVEHPPWCNGNHEPGVPAHTSSVHTIQHGSSTIDVSLRDYGLNADVVVSVDIVTELDSLVLDLTAREAIGLYSIFGDLLDAAGSA